MFSISAPSSLIWTLNLNLRNPNLNLQSLWSLHNTCRGHQLRLTECCPSVWPRQIPLRVQIKVDGPESLEIKHEQTEASFPGDLRRCQIFERSLQQCWLFNFSKIKILCMKITWRGQLTGWSRVSSKQHSFLTKH